MRTRVILIALLIACAALVASAQEKAVLSAPAVYPNNTGYTVQRLTVQFDDPSTATIDEGSINVQLLGDNGESLSCVYNSLTSPTGSSLATSLNKANLSTAYAANATTGSLKQRIFHRLVVMGEASTVCGKALAGTLGGSVP